ncbi:MAG: methyl-accepting chemotaxis protein [Proteobacteria bacterium]|nr:methyl-accepting chemotaxis protein [Pseudomonadota bacterium]
MTNLSSLSKTGAFIGASAALSACGIASTALGASVAVTLPLLVLSAGACGLAALRLGAVSRYIARVGAALTAVSTGNLEERLPLTAEHGALGALGESYNNAVDRVDAYMREASASLQYVSRNQYFRLIDLRGMRGTFKASSEGTNAAVKAIGAKVIGFYQVANDFENTMGVMSTSFAGSAEQLQSSAERMQSAAVGSAERGASGSESAIRANERVRTVATAADEMANSIQEINRQTSTASGMTARAVTEATRAAEVIGGFAEAAAQISQVVDLINEIAEQTNLLALNATIEAARAGEAGKGFAVVASEVKNLASQTAKATGEITERIGSMRVASADSVKAITAITGAIRDISEVAGAIASAVETQVSSMKRVSENVDGATASATAVQEDIVAVRDAAQDTRREAAMVLTASAGIKDQAQALRGTVDAFVVNLKKVI